ncbi:MAG: hypothetical protein GY729_13725 [Desulfobacteraceae bacterium]|nr:hypothetical protein [Desulfobacteraceae bacterium]
MKIPVQAEEAKGKAGSWELGGPIFQRKQAVFTTTPSKKFFSRPVNFKFFGAKNNDISQIKMSIAVTADFKQWPCLARVRQYIFI